MPTLKRPNAPQRLPTSAIEGSAFRRIRHESTKAPPSPLPWPTPLPLPPYQTPPLSPTAVAKPSRTDPRSQETGSPGARAFLDSSITDYTSLTAHTLRRALNDTPSPISPGTNILLQPNPAKLDPRKASSPAAIPTDQSSIQRRASHKLASRRVRSEAVPKPVLEDLGTEGIPTVTALESIAPGITSDVVWMATRPKSNESLQSGRTSTGSSRSSLGAKTRKLLNSPKLRISKEVTRDGEPPREARKGFMWQHESSGHWLEIRIGKRGRSESRSGSTPQDLTPVAELLPTTPPTPMVLSPDPISPPNSPRNPRPDKFAALSGMDQETPSTMVSQPESPSPVRREGLYDRTKRRLGLRRKTADPLSTYHNRNPRTKTTDVLNRTASALRLISIKQHTPPAAESTSSSALSMASHPAIFPVHQRHNNLSSTHQRHDSTSSSIRSLMLGKAPPGTPAEQETYTGSDQQQYFRVELTDPGAPTFLPSEARRINTPPSGKRKGPGFFFDYTAPLDAPPFERRPTTDKYGGSASLFSDDNDSDKENDDNDAASLHTTAKKHNHKKSRRVSVTEWYRVKLDAIDAETPREQARMAFVEEVPDHLPNSPLCPRNPKHKSGGRGVCAMHGRQEGSTPTEGRTPLPLPSSVFGGGRDGMWEVEDQVHRLEYC